MKRLIQGLMIALALFLCCNISYAETEWRYAVENDTACDCSIAGSYLMRGGSPTGLGASCSYYHEPENTVKGTQILYLYSSFTFWDKIESTKKTLRLHKEQQYEPYLKTLKNSDKNIIVQSIETEDSFSLISRYYKVGNEYGNNDKKQFSYEVNRQVRYDDYALITIKGTWRTNGEDPQDESVIATINSMENCMKKVIDDSINDGTSKYTNILLVEGKPMRNVVIYTKEDEDDHDKHTTTNDKGEFSIKLEDEENFDLVIELINMQDNHEYFRLVKKKETPIKLILKIRNSDIIEGTIDTGTLKVPIDADFFDSKKTIELDKIFTADEAMLGPAINYMHYSEALEFYKDYLKINDMSQVTIDVALYNGEGASYNYDTETNRHWILMSTEHSRYESEYRPFVAYHEFSHYVQHLLYGEVFEDYSNLLNINHGGYANIETGDSYSEGYAAFMATVIANYYDRYWTNDTLQKTYSLYPLAGSLNTEWVAYKMEGNLEEFSMAALFWDILDGDEEIKQELDLFKPVAKALLEEVINSSDMDKDGSLSKQEYLFNIIDQEVNVDLNDYFSKQELEDANFTDVINMLEINNKLDKEGGVSKQDFWVTMIGNWKYFDDEWKKVDSNYEDVPDKITVDDLMKVITNTTDSDGMDLTFEQMWKVFEKPHKSFTEIYDSFSKIVDKKSLENSAIKKGLFIDTSKGNGEYDIGEPYQDRNNNDKYDKDETYVDLGDMQYQEDEIVGTPSNYQRLKRESFKPLRGQYVKVNEEVPYYDIKYVVYGVDYYGLKLPSSVFKIRAGNQNGLIYVPIPTEYSTMEINAEGVETLNPLTISSAEFENNYEEVLGKGYIKEHEFEYEGELPVYASSFGNNSNGDFWLWFFLIVFGVILYFGFKKMSEKKIGKSKRESKKKKSNE